MNLLYTDILSASSQQEITDGLAANGAISINEHDQRKFGEDSDDQTERIEEEDTYEIAEPGGAMLKELIWIL